MQPATSHAEAYAFDSPLTLEAMLASLNAAGPWSWTLRDSDTFYLYLVTRPDGGPTKLRIIRRIFPDEGLPFLLDAFYLQGSPENRLSRDEVEQVIQRQVLPAIQAHNAQAIGGL
jgi:hypothetical protein